MHVAVLEDEVRWVGQLRAAAAGEHWTLDVFNNCIELLVAVQTQRFDAVISDIHLAGQDSNGVQALQILRRNGIRLPVMFLTQFNTDYRASHSLDAGADDYMVKPFEADELSARLRAMIRRNDQLDSTLLNIGPLRVSRYYKSVHWMDEPLPLRGQGFDVLAVLAEYRGDVVSRDVLWKSVWREFDKLPPQIRPIEAAISRLRKDVQQVTLAPVISTVSRRGYRLAIDEW